MFYIKKILHAGQLEFYYFYRYVQVLLIYKSESVVS